MPACRKAPSRAASKIIRSCNVYMPRYLVPPKQKLRREKARIKSGAIEPLNARLDISDMKPKSMRRAAKSARASNHRLKLQLGSMAPKRAALRPHQCVPMARGGSARSSRGKSIISSVALCRRRRIQPGGQSLGGNHHRAQGRFDYKSA